MTRVVVVVSGGIAQQVLSHGEDVKNLVLYRDPAACKDHVLADVLREAPHSTRLCRVR
jgi:hypothetical protein